MAGSADTSSSRFVLRRRADATVRANDLTPWLAALPGVTVLDASPRMLLVEAPRLDLETGIALFGGWDLMPEAMIPLPDPRVKIVPTP